MEQPGLRSNPGRILGRIEDNDRLHEAVATIEATNAIREVLYRYCRGLDRMDREMARATWHPDGTADYGEPLYVGTGYGFVEWVFPGHAAMAIHSHQITNILIDVDLAGDRAASEAYVMVTLRGHPTGATVAEIVSCGRYVDQWSRRDGVWAIDHRQYLNDITTVIQLDAGDVATQAPTRARRDTTDSSYANFAALRH
jgi:hypothetical protein